MVTKNKGELMPKKLVNYEVIDMTSEEVSQLEADAKVIEGYKKNAEQKKANKASGNQKLKDLGLTEDEITALVS